MRRTYLLYVALVACLAGCGGGDPEGPKGPTPPGINPNVCDDGQVLGADGECVPLIVCGPGEKPSSDGTACEPMCPGGQELVGFSCLPECPEGQARVRGVCKGASLCISGQIPDGNGGCKCPEGKKIGYGGLCKDEGQGGGGSGGGEALTLTLYGFPKGGTPMGCEFGKPCQGMYAIAKGGGSGKYAWVTEGLPKGFSTKINGKRLDILGEAKELGEFEVKVEVREQDSTSEAVAKAAKIKVTEEMAATFYLCNDAYGACGEVRPPAIVVPLDHSLQLKVKSHAAKYGVGADGDDLSITRDTGDRGTGMFYLRPKAVPSGEPLVVKTDIRLLDEFNNSKRIPVSLTFAGDPCSGPLDVESADVDLPIAQLFTGTGREISGTRPLVIKSGKAPYAIKEIGATTADFLHIGTKVNLAEGNPTIAYKASPTTMFSLSDLLAGDDVINASTRIYEITDSCKVEGRKPSQFELRFRVDRKKETLIEKIGKIKLRDLKMRMDLYVASDTDFGGSPYDDDTTYMFIAMVGEYGELGRFYYDLNHCNTDEHREECWLWQGILKPLTANEGLPDDKFTLADVKGINLYFHDSSVWHSVVIYIGDIVLATKDWTASFRIGTSRDDTDHPIDLLPFAWKKDGTAQSIWHYLPRDEEYMRPLHSEGGDGGRGFYDTCATGDPTGTVSTLRVSSGEVVNYVQVGCKGITGLDGSHEPRMLGAGAGSMAGGVPNIAEKEGYALAGWGIKVCKYQSPWGDDDGRHPPDLTVLGEIVPVFRRVEPDGTVTDERIEFGPFGQGANSSKSACSGWLPRLCPQGEVMTAVSGSAGQYVDRLVGHCSDGSIAVAR